MESLVAADSGRRDLHNIGIHTEAAQRDFCANTHLPSGRVCLLPARHRGGCQFSHASAIPDRRSLPDRS
jgi:hypothetical protein